MRPSQLMRNLNTQQQQAPKPLSPHVKNPPLIKHDDLNKTDLLLQILWSATNEGLFNVKCCLLLAALYVVSPEVPELPSTNSFP